MEFESFDILQDIREVFHGLGEKKPRWDTVNVMQSVLLKQMSILIYQTHQTATDQCSSQITIKHIIHVLRHHKLTLIRILTYYLLKHIFPKLNALTRTMPTTVVEAGSTLKSNKSYDQYLIDGIMVDTKQDSEHDILDPVSFLKSLDFKSNIYKNPKKKSVFWHVCEAIADQKLDLKITQEDIDNSTLERKIRVDELSLVISNEVYESFQLCRKKNFQYKLGTILLAEVNYLLPVDIEYSKEARDLFLFLAKETIACLFDRVRQRRNETNPPNNANNTQLSSLKKKLREYVIVAEILAVTSAVWDNDFGKIRGPFEDDDDFLSNTLIFD